MPPAATNTPTPTSGGATQLFDDEFEDGSLNTNKWTDGFWWDNNGCTNAGNHELEWYQSNDVIVSNGTLKLKAERRTVVGSDGNTYNYTSGLITTGRAAWQDSAPDKFGFQYGYVEIRAKVPKGTGLQPSFWLLASDQTWPPEVTAMSILGNQPNAINLEFTDSSGTSTNHMWNGPDFSDGWHTFALDWQPKSMTWYVDGVRRWRVTDKNRIPAEAMYLVLNLAVGGDWAGAPDASTVFPANLEVDYVRAWNKTPFTRSEAGDASTIYLPLVVK